MEERHGATGEGSSGMEKAKSKAGEAKEKAREMKDQAEEKAEELASEARDRGKDAMREGKEKARELGDEANRFAHSRAEEQKDRLSGGMRTMADALRHGTDQLPEDRRQYGSFLETVADRVEGVSRYLDERDVDGLTREARQAARDHTSLFLGGAFALGLAGARFLKSSGSEARGGSDWETGRGRTDSLSSGSGGMTRGDLGGGGAREPGSTPMRSASRTEEWTRYEREPAPPYPRSSSVRDAADRAQEEGGYE